MAYLNGLQFKDHTDMKVAIKKQHQKKTQQQQKYERNSCIKWIMDDEHEYDICHICRCLPPDRDLTQGQKPKGRLKWG